MDEITCFCEDGSRLGLADDSGLINVLSLPSAGELGYGPWYQLLDEERPLFCLFEVPDTLLKFPGRDFGIMLARLFSMGYNAEWRVVDAGGQGRVFVFAFCMDTRGTCLGRGLVRRAMKHGVVVKIRDGAFYAVDNVRPIACRQRCAVKGS